MTEQEVFNMAWEHLVTKASPKAYSPSLKRCVYRGAAGSRCVVGAMVTDEECAGWDYAKDSRVQHVDLPARLLPHVKLLARLQEVHDSEEDVEARRRALRVIATRYQLQVPA